MHYNTLLFDIDNTLLDTYANEQHALIELCAALHFELTPAKINYYHQLNQHLWQQFEHQEMDRPYLLDHRFQLFFAHFGRNVDGPATQEQFAHYFHKEARLIPHAAQTLQQLQPDHTLCIISNGTRRKQHAQMRAAHLDQYFTQTFLSEDVGYRKPDRHFFDAVLAQMSQVDPHTTIVIGDSLTADIAGANAATIDSIWFNPHHVRNETTSRPTYEVTDLAKIIDVVD